MLFFRIAPYYFPTLLLTIIPVEMHAGELVQFDAVSTDARAITLLGYLARPRRAEAGPFPAVVVLHHCAGFDDLVVSWADRLSYWGYVALAVDSFGPRKVPGNCTGRTYQAMDPSSALNFLARQDFVDSSRVAVIGFSQGGTAALRDAEQDSTFAKSHPDTFRAAVAFYPDCGGISGVMSVPTLVLIGDMDNWTPATACQAMSEGRGDWGISRERSTALWLASSSTLASTTPLTFPHCGGSLGGYELWAIGLNTMPKRTPIPLRRSKNFFDPR